MKATQLAEGVWHCLDRDQRSDLRQQPGAMRGDARPLGQRYSVMPSIRRARTRLPLTSPAFNFANALSAIARSTAT